MRCTDGCTIGRYGALCTETCQNCVDELCHQNTGVCLHCEKCSDGKCHQDTGVCFHCEPGWMGPHCELGNYKYIEFHPMAYYSIILLY